MISIAHPSEPSSAIRAKNLSGGPLPLRSLADPAERTDSNDEYRDRMRVNLFAAIVLVVLMGVGIWLVNIMVDSQKARGCYSSGEHTCSLI